MLSELHVRDLGVIADLTLVLEPGMTALTGETGAGKTLLVEAVELLLGERADSVLVRPGADEARVEGRFVSADGEVVVARRVPRVGRSRGYIDGRLASASELAELGRALVDLHGQHAHQSLLDARVQRAALDRFGSVDVEELRGARRRLAEVEADLAALGGDARSRAREVDVLSFQVAELTEARVEDPDEDERLAAEEEVLASAASLRSAAEDAYRSLSTDGGAADAVHAAVAAVAGRRPFAATESRLRAVAAELDDAASELRAAAEGIVDDPDRAEAVRARRQALRSLCRKYGERLSDVIAYRAEAERRLAELQDREGRAGMLEEQRGDAERSVTAEAARVGTARRTAAPRLADAVAGHLRELALPRARLEVAVAGAEGEHVEILLGANPGEAALPLAKVASGGELARTMLAARLVLSEAPPTLVFDEVDAGIGGEAALAIGRALAALGADHQVLVVTHLAQVAAFAHHQVAVTKSEEGGRTLASARPVSGDERVVELSRMLLGQPDSDTARRHAAELLVTAARQRERG